MTTKLCRPILIESKNLSTTKGQLCLNGNYLFTARESDNVHPLKPQQLVLISLDPNEKIKINDKFIYKETFLDGTVKTRQDFIKYNWILTTCNKEDLPYIERALYGINSKKGISGIYKVMTTQEQLSPKYIQQFIQEYNTNSVKDIEIEMRIIFEPYYKDTEVLNLKNNFVNIITNTKSQIFYTEEEVSDLLFKLQKQIISKYSAQFTNINIVEWFEKNKKQYHLKT